MGTYFVMKTRIEHCFSGGLSLCEIFHARHAFGLAYWTAWRSGSNRKYATLTTDQSHAALHISGAPENIRR